MEGQFITAKAIGEFKEHLILAECSGATVEKYIRDVKAFSVYTQKAQIELLSRLMSATETLTTKEELTEYMNEQLNILTENNAQCQAAVTEFQNKMRKSATEFTDSMKTAVSDTEKRVGRISDFYSNNLSMLTDTAEKYLSRIFWITVIPSAITALYYLTLLILQLI